MAYDGIPRELPKFLARLAQNNNREWFEDHKEEFGTVCKAPMLALVEELEPFAKRLRPPHRGEARLNGSLRRINRDTRFSKDKTPYHTHLHLIFWTGAHPNRSPGIHLIFGTKGFGIGAGHWDFGKDGLERYRAAVCDRKKYAELRKALASAEADGQVPDPPALKKLPRGWSAEDEDQSSLLRRKGLVVRTLAREQYDERLFGPESIAYLKQRMRALEPLQRWLAENV